MSTHANHHVLPAIARILSKGRSAKMLLTFVVLSLYMVAFCVFQVLQNILEAEREYSRELQSLLGCYLRSLQPTDRLSYVFPKNMK